MELKDWLNSINTNKQDLSEDPEACKKYPAYIVNRCMSGHIDAILFANEMNKNTHLSKDMQYHFMLHSLRKKKRFSPWLKQEKIADLEVVKKYYGYSNEKAQQALKILSPEQIKFIHKKMDTGGIKK
jgi:hypothetical protein